MIGIGRGELDRLYAFGTLGSMLHKLDGTDTELYFETQPLMEQKQVYRAISGLHIAS